MASTDRYKHESNNKGDTSMKQQGNAAKSGDGATATPPSPDAGPDAGENEIYGRHVKELDALHKMHKSEMDDMFKRHSIAHADLYKRHASEIGRKDEPQAEAQSAGAKKEV